MTASMTREPRRDDQGDIPNLSTDRIAIVSIPGR
jgi:hypothetical protein